MSVIIDIYTILLTINQREPFQMRRKRNKVSDRKMGLFTGILIGIVIVSPLDASLFSSTGRRDGKKPLELQDRPTLRYFGRPNIHFKNFEAPVRVMVYEPELSEESDDSIEQLIKAAILGKLNSLHRKHRSNVDIDYL